MTPRYEIIFNMSCVKSEIRDITQTKKVGSTQHYNYILIRIES